MDKKQFFHLFNNSLKISINDNLDSIFYVYNESIERQIKYNRLFNLNNPIKYTLNKDDILFEQDINNKYLWYDYKKIYLTLRENNEYKDLEISNLIKSWLVDETNWNQYTPLGHSWGGLLWLNDDTNWKQYTPVGTHHFFVTELDDDTNWKQYTSADIYFTQTFELDDDTN